MKNFLLNLLWIPIFSFSQFGILDVNFGNNGIAMHNNPIPRASVDKINKDSQGNIYIMGSFSEFVEGGGPMGEDVDVLKMFLAKLNPDGSINTDFGENGFVKYAIPNGLNFAADFEIIDDQHILVVGNFEQFSKWIDEQSNIFLLRFNLNGSLDETFGIDGLFMNSLEDFRLAKSIIRKGDSFFILESHSYGGGFYIEKRFLNGDVDFNFGIAGIVSFLNGGVPNGSRGFIINDMNEFFVIHWHDYVNRYYIKKLNPNAELMYEIYITLDDMEINSIASFNDKIYLNGKSNNNFVLRSYNSDLTVNENFGENGIVERNLGFGEQGGKHLLIGANNRLTQVGYVREGTTSQFALAGYYSNGNTDYTFGTAGVTLTDVTTNNVDVPKQSIFVAADQLLVLNTTSTDVGISLAQYTIYDGLSVEDISTDSKIQIAPNPTSNSFVISGINGHQNQVQMIDLTGKIIQEFQSVQNNQTLNLGAIPKGNYIIKINSKDKFESKKLIVK